MKHINDNLRDILPQKEPFRFIDSVKEINYNNNSITCLYSFKGDNPIFKGHFPGEPIVPGVLLIESIAQSSIILMKSITGQSDEGLYLLSKVEKITFREVLLPNENATIMTRLDRTISGFHFFSSKVYNSKGKKIMEGKFIVYLKK